jgi:hypothetical protein
VDNLQVQDPVDQIHLPGQAGDTSWLAVDLLEGGVGKGRIGIMANNVLAIVPRIHVNLSGMRRVFNTWRFF